jgi:YHS domain-containing protein
MPDVEIEYQRSASLKNLPEPMDLYEIVLTSAPRQCVIDPVCKMQVDMRRAAGDLQYRGRKYWFCSLSCVERFVEQPSSYAP